MANATFLTWSDFKANTSVTLPRYYIDRGDGNLAQALGVHLTREISHVYTPANEEEIATSGMGSDAWFVGALQVATFSA